MTKSPLFQTNKIYRSIIIALSVAVFILLVSLILALVFRTTSSAPTLSTLPAPETATGIRGAEFGIDANINESTIDNYLHRSDSVYRDMRMLSDPGNYEAIGGDSYLSGYIDGFEIVPLPYLVNVSGLPDEVGSTYSGPTLFTEQDGTYTANYVESWRILEALFPKDKYIFLMCGGGGYAGMTKQMLIALGWDANKIYNVGGFWFYEGEHSIPVKTTIGGETAYAFWSVPYHNIDFSALTKKAPGKLETTTAAKVNALVDAKQSFLLFVSQPDCESAKTLQKLLTEVATKYSLHILQINFSDLTNVPSAAKIKFYPSLAVFVDGQLVDFLDADSDDDTAALTTLAGLETWLERYVDLR